MVSTLDQGIYLIMRLPKDKVEVFASLHSTHPTQFDYAYKARLRNERDKVSVFIILEKRSRYSCRVYFKCAYFHLRNIRAISSS